MKLLYSINTSSFLITSLLFFLTFSTVSCQGDNNESVPEKTDLSVSNVVLADIDNNGIASDFRVTFTKKASSTLISEFRIFLVNDATVNFDVEKAESIQSGSYLSISPDESNYVYLSENSKSINGEPIDANSFYTAYILSIASNIDNGNSLSEASNSVQLQNSTLVETLNWAGTLNTEGVSIDSDGGVYVTNLGLTGIPGNFNGSQVYKITNNEFSVFNNSLSAPLGHAFDSNNILYVANFNKTELTQINTAGIGSTYISDEKLTGGDVIFDKNGNLYVTVIKSSSVFKITPSKEIIEVSSGNNLNSPVGIAVDDDGNVYAANFGNGDIVKILTDGTQNVLAKIPSQVGYICLANNLLYATGYSSSVIYSITLEGNYSILIGNGNQTTKDGDSTNASFENPNGIAASPDGNYLYVSQSNGKLRKIALAQ